METVADEMAVQEEIMKKAAKTAKKAKARKVKPAKGTKGAKSNGIEPMTSKNTVITVKPAPKDGPNLTLRMRADSDIARIKKAAEKAGLSMNTWAVEVLGQAAEAQ